jgi:hypothetical protein
MRNYDKKEFFDLNGKGTAFAQDVKKVKVSMLPTGNPVLPEDAGSIQNIDKNIKAGLKTIKK